MATRRTPGKVTSVKGKSPIEQLRAERRRNRQRKNPKSVVHIIKSSDVSAERKRKILKEFRKNHQDGPRQEAKRTLRKRVDNWDKLTDEQKRKRIEQYRENQQKNKGDGKGKGGKGKGDGKGKGKKHGPFYKQAKRMVRQELRPQLQEINRMLDRQRAVNKQAIGQEIRMGNRTQSDLEAIFGRAAEFNTEQNAKIAQVLGQSGQVLGNQFNASSDAIDAAYNKANEGAEATLARLGIQPVSARLQEDQAWLQGLNESNRAMAAQALAAQQGIFAQGGGMLGQAIAGEGATRMGEAATATAEAIRRAREQGRMGIQDLQQQRSDLRSNRGMLINQAQQLLKQQAFEQMMEQQQLMALNKQRAAQMKLDWAELNSLNKYRKAQLQQQANETALDKWKAEQDVWLRKLDMKLDAKGEKNGERVTRADFMKPGVNLSGWNDATQYSFYMYGKKHPKQYKVIRDVIYDMKSSWGRDYDVSDPGGRQQLYQLARARLQKEGIWGTGTDRLIRDILSIGAGTF